MTKSSSNFTYVSYVQLDVNIVSHMARLEVRGFGIISAKKDVAYQSAPAGYSTPDL